MLSHLAAVVFLFSIFNMMMRRQSIFEIDDEHYSDNYMIVKTIAIFHEVLIPYVKVCRTVSF